MIRWRIWYADGATFDDSMGDPSEAPARGVLSIQQRTDCGHHPSEWLKPEQNLMGHGGAFFEMLEGADWFWWVPADGRWVRGDLFGMIDQFMHCGAQFLKQGRYVSHELWEEHLMAVGRDRDYA